MSPELDFDIVFKEVMYRCAKLWVASEKALSRNAVRSRLLFIGTAAIGCWSPPVPQSSRRAITNSNTRN